MRHATIRLLLLRHAAVQIHQKRDATVQMFLMRHAVIQNHLMRHDTVQNRLNKACRYSHCHTFTGQEIYHKSSPPRGWDDCTAPSVPIYASVAYGCALAHSPQTTREVRATFYSRLSQYGPHAAPCTFGREGPCRTVPGAVPRRCTPGFHRSPPWVGAISPAIYPCPTLGFDPAGGSIYDKSHDR